MQYEETEQYKIFRSLKPNWVKSVELRTEDNGNVSVKVVDSVGKLKMYAEELPNDLYQWMVAHPFYGYRVKQRYRPVWFQKIKPTPGAMA